MNDYFVSGPDVVGEPGLPQARFVRACSAEEAKRIGNGTHAAYCPRLEPRVNVRDEERYYRARWGVRWPLILRVRIWLRLLLGVPVMLMEDD